MILENLIGPQKPILIWSDGNLRIYANSDRAGNIWVHYDIDKLTPSLFRRRAEIMEFVFSSVKSKTGVDKLSGWCKSDAVLNWALAWGWEPVAEGKINEMDVVFVEYK